MGLIYSSQIIDKRRLPRVVVVYVSVVDGIFLGYIFSAILLSRNNEGTTSSRAIMYRLYKWGFRPSESMFWSFIAFLDIWLPIILTVIISLPAIYILQRILRKLTIPCVVRRPGYCQPCGYDLQGNVSGVCPDCGAPVVREPEDRLPKPIVLICYLIVLLFLIMVSIWMLMPSLAR